MNEYNIVIFNNRVMYMYSMNILMKVIQEYI